MVKTLFRAIVLVGLGLVVGFGHAQLNKTGDSPLMLGLPPRDAEGAKPTPAPPSPGAPQAANPEQKPAPEQTPPAAAQTPGNPESAPGPVSTTPAAPPPAQAAAPEAEADDGYFISIAKAKELYDGKQSGAWDGIFIDARPFHEFTQSHIPGAMHIDKKYFDGAVPAKVRNYLPGMPVVIYCHGENCTDSEAVAARLIALKRSIGPIHIIKEGLPGWIAAGHPTVSGPEVGFE